MILYRGAEADLVVKAWQDREAIYKVRRPLHYRLRVLDDSIRRQRTIHEAQMLHHAKGAGVEVPFVYAVDVPEATIVMEFVRGERLRDRADSFGEEEASRTFEKFGRSAAKLHSSGIMHGDLTTANVVLRKGSVVFVDFGLSYRTTRLEDHAVDLRLIKETLGGAHPGVSQAAFGAFLRGYAKVVGPSRSRKVLRQLRSIERRGRYARME